ncbi:T9SS type A sorting domain-containing protein [Epilithonimonas caeni]|uniref:T9SS type A sorting domain-containing protein n=1 Tax=Epilithonimonas caeni TaxID=365343 RepID=UPI00041A5A31|nr:T9SS type A sorting domain-containing protein [Epilithonimonas caeni]
MKKLYLLFLLFSFYNFYSQENLNLKNLLQVNTNTQGKITPNFIKTDTNGNIYSNTIVSGQLNFFNKSLNIGNNKASVFAKLNPSGIIAWSSMLVSSDLESSSYSNSDHNIDIRPNGEMIYGIRTSADSFFYDSDDISTPLNNFSHEIIKLSSNGKLKWKKTIINPANFSAKLQCSYDQNGDIIIWYYQQMPQEQTGTEVIFDNTSLGSIKSFIAKLNGETGNVEYVKSYKDLDAYIGTILFDENNEMYIFYEPIDEHTNKIYNFGNIQIMGNDDYFNFFMIKFNQNGEPIFGKNFYESIPAGTYKYSWPIDVKYDGNNFITYEVIGSQSPIFIGLDNNFYSNPYSNKTLANSISKITKEGQVLGTLPIFTSGTYDYNSFDVDKNGNTYIYGRWFDKVHIQDKEYSLPSYSSNVLKVYSNGVVDFFEPLVQNSFQDNNQKISIVPNGNILLSGNTSAISIKNHPINSLGGDNYYIAVLEEEVLKTDEVNKISINIYPNPTSDFINIITKEKINNIDIYDSTGRKVTAEYKLNNQIDVRKLINGIYYIKIKTDKNNLTSKFIKK